MSAEITDNEKILHYFDGVAPRCYAAQQSIEKHTLERAAWIKAQNKVGWSTPNALLYVYHVELALLYADLGLSKDFSNKVACDVVDYKRRAAVPHKK